MHGERRPRLGAYGLRLHGVGGAAPILQPAPAEWLPWRVRHEEVSPPRAEPDSSHPWRLSSTAARLPLSGGGWVEIDRETSTSTLRLATAPAPHQAVHPYLASTAAVVARWRGWHCFHGGGFVLNGAAWVILGGKEAGKSSLLAWLALERRLQVLADDVQVLDSERRALAGPRCIDLRKETSGHLGAGRPIGLVGARERWRLELEAGLSAVPLAGWIDLRWGGNIEMELAPPSEALGVLADGLALRMLPPKPETLFELCDLPLWRLQRPRSFDSLQLAGDSMLSGLA